MRKIVVKNRMSNDGSKLWGSLTSSIFSNIDDFFMSKFRTPGGANNRLAAWDPLDASSRYFKFLLYNSVKMKNADFFSAYESIGNTNVGSPVTVKVAGCDINIDHFLAVDEAMFLAAALPESFASINSVVEIGAGFGRTAQALLSLHDTLDRYIIVDLPNMLNLSRNYLKTILSKNLFSKLKFVSSSEMSEWDQAKNANLVINIDSFQEMRKSTIAVYMKEIVLTAEHFYCKNPVGKYDPRSVNLNPDEIDMKDVLDLGLCTDVIDIFDDEALRTAAQKYVEAYRPGKSWKIVADAPLDIFPYLHHVLYENTGR